jgi:hypothetical protein
MLRAYIDDSGSSPDQRVFTLGGVVSSEESWAAFTIEWNELCAAAPAVPNVHLRKIYSVKHRCWGKGSLKERRAAMEAKMAQFASLVAKYGMLRIHAGITWGAYTSVMKGNLPSEMDHPYFFLFLRVLQAAVRWQESRQSSDQVHFIFDQQGKLGTEAAGWYSSLGQTFTDREAKVLACEPSFRSSADTPPLMAADMCAWYARREVIERDASLKSGAEYRRTIAMETLWSLPYVASNIDRAQLAQLVNAAGGQQDPLGRP